MTTYQEDRDTITSMGHRWMMARFDGGAPRPYFEVMGFLDADPDDGRFLHQPDQGPLHSFGLGHQAFPITIRLAEAATLALEITVPGWGDLSDCRGVVIMELATGDVRVGYYYRAPGCTVCLKARCSAEKMRPMFDTYPQDRHWQEFIHVMPPIPAQYHPKGHG